MKLYEIRDLTKVYGQATSLDIPELDIVQGPCFGLVGNNGAGKTTLFRLILDLIRPTTGKVLFEGVDVVTDEAWKDEVGAYLDEHMLLGYLSPDEYFETLRKMHRLSAEDLERHLERFTEFFNGEVTGHRKYIRDLSKGNIKKVGIAAATLGQPRTVLLDEPFENLDPTSQIRLKKLIRRFREEEGTTFLISSHDLSHITEIADRIVLLEKGRILQDITDKEGMDRSLKDYFGRM